MPYLFDDTVIKHITLASTHLHTATHTSIAGEKLQNNFLTFTSITGRDWKKMTRIDASTVLPVLDEVSHITLVYFLIGVLIIYIAWRSTFVRHEARNIPYRQRTVFIFNPQTGDFQQHSLGLLLNNLNNNFAQTTPTFESILDEMNGITYQTPPQQDENIDDDSVIEEETQEIIREMDREPNILFDANSSGLRNRRTNAGYVKFLNGPTSFICIFSTNIEQNM